MSGFISMRFKGTVLEVFREEIFLAFIGGSWDITKDEILCNIRNCKGGEPKIPFKDLRKPKEWLEATGQEGQIGNGIDRITGEWEFTFTTDCIEEFDALMNWTLPFIMESVEICEVWREYAAPYDYNKCIRKIRKYKLIDNKWHEVEKSDTVF